MKSEGGKTFRRFLPRTCELALLSTDGERISKPPNLPRSVGAGGQDWGTVAYRAKEHPKSVLGPASKLNSGVGWSPEFPGRVIAALTMVYALESRLCGTLINADLAAEYGLTANDGCVIPRFGLFAQHTIESRELRQGEAEE